MSQFQRPKLAASRLNRIRCSLSRNAASTSLSWVTSRAVLEAPTIFPEASFTGEMVSDTVILFFSLKFRRNDQSDRLSNSLFFRVAEYALRSRVPAGDDPVKVFRDNCVLRRLHDRCQSGSYFFNRLLLGDIYARANVTLELALRANTRDSVTEYPAKFPVRTAQTVFHFVGLAGVKRGQICIDTPLTIVGMDSFHPPIPQFLLQGSSGEVKPALVEVRRKRVRTGNPNHRWHGIGHVLELPVFRLLRLLSIGRFRQWWLLFGLRRNRGAIRDSGL